MTAEEEFAENTEIFADCWSGRADFKAWEAFTAQHDDQIAKGYLMALNDLLPKIKELAAYPNNIWKREMEFALCEAMNNVLRKNLHLRQTDQSDSDANLPPPHPA